MFHQPDAGRAGESAAVIVGFVASRLIVTLDDDVPPALVDEHVTV